MIFGLSENETGIDFVLGRTVLRPFDVVVSLMCIGRRIDRPAKW